MPRDRRDLALSDGHALAVIYVYRILNGLSLEQSRLKTKLDISAVVQHQMAYEGYVYPVS